MISKKIREIVYKKYNGHCAYCGCKIEYKDMQIDHIVPKYRNNEKWHQGEIGTDDMENLNPSCRACNYYKRMSSLEQFRENLSTMLIANVRRPFDYRLAVKYGLEGRFVCLNPDAEKPPYNNAFCYAKTPNEALQGLYDWW